jgi:hypothetical protein
MDEPIMGIGEFGMFEMMMLFLVVLLLTAAKRGPPSDFR